MQQRDFIKDEIEKLGRVLGQVVAELIGTSSNDFSESRRSADHVLRAELDMDLEALLQLDLEQLAERLLEVKWPESSLDQLAMIFTELAKRETLQTKRLELFHRALDLYHLAGKRSKSYSFERASAMADIQAQLEN